MRIEWIAGILAVFLSSGVGLAKAPTSQPVLRKEVAKSASVYFSPKGGCEEAIVEQIHSAKKSLDVQAYGFTSAPIAEAIAKAHERGVQVRVVLDRSNRTAKYSAATYLDNHRVPTFIDAKHAIAHNKVMLIDGETVITGSFNFSKSAENENAENVLILRGYAELQSAYRNNFEEHLRHSEKYVKEVAREN